MSPDGPNGFWHIGVSARELGRTVTVEDVKPRAAAAIAEVFALELEAERRLEPIS